MAKKPIDTRTQAEFEQNPAAAVQAAQRTDRPVVVMAGDRPAAVVLSPKAYRRLRTLARRRTEEDKKLLRSLADADAGRTRDAFAVLDELAAKHGIKPAT